MVADQFEEEEFELIASELDERTHAELLMMYREAAESIRFSKKMQWTTLGLGSLVQAGLMVFAEYAYLRMHIMVPATIIACAMVTAGAVYILIVHQMLQNMERLKLREISKHLSNLSRNVRSLRAPLEAAFHRYTLLMFMIIGLIGTCGFVIKFLTRLV